MAQRLLLTNDDGTETLDLLQGALRVVNWGWEGQPTSLAQRLTSLPFGVQASSLGYPQVVETLSLVASGCTDRIRATIQCLEVFLENAKAYMDDPIDGDPHWLEWRSEGELAKRALVVGGTWQWRRMPPDAWQMIDGEMLLLNLALTRHPLWERTEEIEVTTSALSSIGGAFAFATTPGRVPARLAVAEITGGGNSSANRTATIWAGFRPNYHGFNDFDPVWECESAIGAGAGDSTLDVDTADAGPDVLYHNGYVAVTTFTDANMARRLLIQVFDVLGGVTLNARSFAGRYLVLCRCWTSDDTEDVVIQMRSGYAGDYVHDPVVVIDEDPRFLELGEVQIPSPGISSTPSGTTLDQMCGDFTIELWAQSASWAGGDTHTLTMDCLVLVPSDFFLKVENGAVYDTGATEMHAMILREADERIYGVREWGQWVGNMTVANNQWYLPAGNSWLIMASERSSSQVIADTLTWALTYYPRWTSYRE